MDSLGLIAMLAYSKSRETKAKPPAEKLQMLLDLLGLEPGDQKETR